MDITSSSTRVAELEQALHQRQFEWQRTFDAITDWVSIIDLDFTIIRSNQSSQRVLGVKSEDIIGKTCYNIVHGTSEPIGECPIPKMLKSGQRGESELHLPDGRWIFVTADPILDGDGGITGAVHMVRDITARKRIEVEFQENQDRLGLAAEAANLGLWDWRMDLKRLFPNRKFLEMSGMTREETLDFTAEVWVGMVHPEDQEETIQVLQSHLAGETQHATIANRIQHPTKGWVWLFGLGQVIERDTQNLPVRMVGVHQDITAQVLLQKEREDLIIKLEKALADVKTLRGMLPICSSCKKIRDDQGYWNRIEDYFHRHSLAQFSHSICPDCAKRLYPDLKIY